VSNVVRGPAFVGVALALAVFVVFAPALGNGFVGYDDPDYVTANPHVREGLGADQVAWALTSFDASNWHPLTWLSHLLDVSLFGLDPRGHHLTSLLLHAANTLLLFLLLRRDTGALGASAFVAGVFGLHPLHVESVVWVAERKDVLSAFFWIATLWSYGRYTREPSLWRYAVFTSCFALGLAAKPMLVTLPLVLLLWDVWPLRRTPLRPLHGRLLEKLPLVALAALSSAITIAAQRYGQALLGVEQLPVGLRAANAVLSYGRYLAKAVWPTRLAAFYPHPLLTFSSARVWGGLLAIAALSVAAIRVRRSRPWITVGWLWYVITLLPVIGFVQVGLQAMADRYMYLPIVGLAIAVGFTVAEAAATPLTSRLTLVGATVLLGLLSFLSWRQAHVWKDGITLWSHALRVTDANFIAHDNLGVELDRQGRYDEAIAEYRETLRLKPGDRHGERNYAQAHFAKGERLYKHGQMEPALAMFDEGLRHDPQNVPAHAYVGAIFLERGQFVEALQAYDAALLLEPGSGLVQANRAVVLLALGRNEEAANAVTAARAAGVEPDPRIVENLRRREPGAADPTTTARSGTTLRSR
jgi:tetratricopeptide (TPR) repeat protein